MKTRLPRWLAPAGFVLLLVALGNWVLTPLRIGDGYTLLRPIADVPLDNVDQNRSLTVTIQAPDDESWRRLRHEYGDPSYLIGLESARNFQECFEDYHLRVEASAPLAHVEEPIFGHSFACKGSPTLRFEQKPGAAVDVTIQKEDSAKLPPLRLIVMTDLATDKRLSRIALDEYLLLISTGIAWAGAGLLVAAAAIWWVAKKRPKGSS